MKIPVLIILIISTMVAKAQDTNNTIVFAQVYYEQAWRIIDLKGNFILSQKYGVGAYQNLCFEEGLAISYDNNKYGFTDFNDNQVIPNKYDAVRCFESGYAAVAVGDKWGIINRQDEFIIEPIYEFAGNFGLEGLAGVKKDGKLGFIDYTGNVVIPFKYYWYPSLYFFPNYPSFDNGLIAIVDKGLSTNINDGKVGFMNVKGEIVIKPQFNLPYAGLPFFMNGITTVYKEGSPIIIDTLGNEILKTEFGVNGFLYFVNGLATIYGESGHQGLINEKGKVILEPIYNGIDAFSEGYAAVQISGDENGVTSAFINSKGEFVFDKKFRFIRSFWHGVAAVQEGKLWGYIDTTGTYIIEPQFASAGDFNNGLAIVSIEVENQLKFGFIDKSGKFIIKPQYNEANQFEFGLAPVKIEDKFGYINEKGEIVIKPMFDNASGFSKKKMGGKK